MIRHTALALFLPMALVLGGVSTSSANPAPGVVEAPVILELARQSIGPGERRALEPRLPSPRSTWQVELTVRADGSWAAGARSGHLQRGELRRLNRAIAATRFTLQPPPRLVCTGFPRRRHQVTASARSIAWASPCADRPDPSVSTLRDLALDLTTRRHRPALRPPATTPDPPVEVRPTPTPPSPVRPAPTPPEQVRPAPPTAAHLVDYRIRSLRSLDGGASIVIRADGSWSADGRAGVLTRAELRDLQRRLAEVTFGPTIPAPACAAMMTGDGSIDAPGFGRYRWSTPCATLHPSLGALVAHMRDLTGGSPRPRR